MRRARIASVVLGASVLFAACGGGSDESPKPTGAVSFAGLCAARDAASEGNLAGAKATFDHGPLHALAAEAEKTDRAAAADLLENKEKVESLSNKDDIEPREFRDALDKLITATRGAQRAAGEPETNCDSESN